MLEHQVPVCTFLGHNEVRAEKPPTPYRLEGPALSHPLPVGLRFPQARQEHRRPWLKWTGCSRSGSNRFPTAHDVFDHLSLLLCCWKLLGKALDSIAEEAGLWHGSIQELYILLLLHVSETQAVSEVVLLDHKRGHHTTQRLCSHFRRSEREVRRSTQLMCSCDHPRAGLSVLWPNGPIRLYKHCQWGLTNTYRPVRGDMVHPVEWKQLLGTVAWPQTAPQRGCLLHHRGWWGGRSHNNYFGQWKVPSTIL